MERIYYFSLVKSLDESKKPFTKITTQYAHIPTTEGDLLSKLLLNNFSIENPITISSLEKVILILQKELNIIQLVEFFKSTLELLKQSEILSLEMSI
jgi:hypothetical protein